MSKWKERFIGGVLAVIVLGAFGVWAATKPTKTEEGKIKPITWSFVAIDSSTTDISDGATFNIRGMTNLGYYVTLSAGATCTPQIRPIGSTNWRDMNSIDESGYYSDPDIFGADLFRFKIEDNSGTVEIVVGGGGDAAKENQ